MNTLFVPGLLCTPEIFGPQIAAVWPYGPVTIASTLDGATIPEMAGNILASAPKKFALAGISMGGYVSMEIMRQAPERVEKLALISTSARADTPEAIEQRKAAIQAAQSGDFTDFVRQMVSRFLHPSRRNDLELLNTCIRMGEAVGLAGFIQQMTAMMTRADSRASLPQIRVPTLVVVGDGDPLIPPERSSEIAQLIPKSELVILPECGHGSTLERPELVNAALVRFWATQNKAQH